MMHVEQIWTLIQTGFFWGIGFWLSALLFSWPYRRWIA